jgi:hypothetical protein
MTKSGFAGKDELKSLIKDAIDFIQDKYDIYLTILPYSDKC